MVKWYFGSEPCQFCCHHVYPDVAPLAPGYQAPHNRCLSTCLGAQLHLHKPLLGVQPDLGKAVVEAFFSEFTHMLVYTRSGRGGIRMLVCSDLYMIDKKLYLYTFVSV